MTEQEDGYMRAGELRELLKGVSDDLLVVLQKDAEGNGYSPLAGGEVAVYQPDSTWSGQVVEMTEDGDPCVVLWPVN